MSVVIKQKAASTITTDTVAYASGDVMGGKLTISSAARISAGTGTIESVTLNCKTAQTFSFDVIFFLADPSASTFTNNSAVAVAAADFDKVVGKVSFTSSDWAALGTPSVADKHKLQIPFKLTAGTSLYAAIVCRGTPTLGSTSDLKLTLGIQQT